MLKETLSNLNNGLIGERRELKAGHNTSVLDDSSIHRLAPFLFLEFIIAHSSARSNYWLKIESSYRRVKEY